MHRLPARINHASSHSLPDDGLSLNGIALRVTGGDDYNLSQRWSGAIHRYHPLVDGIFLCIASRQCNGL
jgi:hypothetical protein